MIRLIASDIDGTLLHNGAAEIDPVIFEEIHRLKQKGILFCPASGRQYHSLRRLFAPAADCAKTGRCSSARATPASCWARR